MAKLQTIRAKLDKKLFNTDVLGSNVQIISTSISGGSYGGYESETETDGTATDTIAVPYNLVYADVSYQPFGDLREGDMDIVFRHDTTIDIDYKVIINSVTYRVKKIENVYLNDGIAAKICRITKD